VNAQEALEKSFRHKKNAHQYAYKWSWHAKLNAISKTIESCIDLKQESLWDHRIGVMSNFSMS